MADRVRRGRMADGFNSFDDMLQWFFKMHGVPFAGVLIKW